MTPAPTTADAVAEATCALGVVDACAAIADDYMWQGKQLADAGRTLRAVLARLAECERDAARYRALRNAEGMGGDRGMCTISSGYGSQYWSGPIVDGIKGGLLSFDQYADALAAREGATHG